MHLPDIDHSHSATGHDTTHSNGGFWINTLLIVYAIGFDLLAEATPDDIYKWSYRIFAIVSIGALAYINVSKAIERFKNKKNNKS